MTEAATIELWLYADCVAGGYGGWAWVVAAAEGLAGAAGGDRRTSAEAMWDAVLAASLARLAKAPRTTRLILRADDGNGRIAGGLRAAGFGSVVVADAKVADQVAFLRAWADFARDKAKVRGAFSAPIPRLNLAKFAGGAI